MLNKPDSEPGKLFIACNPWADVYIDGSLIERTPLMRSVPLQPGDHNIDLKNPNYESFSTSLRIETNKTESLMVTLTPKIGFLNLRVVPWAEVYIDGKSFGITPVNKQIELFSGPHLIELRHPDLKTIIDSIRIEPGKTIEKQYRLRE